MECCKLTQTYSSGQSPMEADLNLLETARRCELYGVKMHSVKVITGLCDSNQVELLACLLLTVIIKATPLHSLLDINLS